MATGWFSGQKYGIKNTQNDEMRNGSKRLRGAIYDNDKPDLFFFLQVIRGDQLKKWGGASGWLAYF